MFALEPKNRIQEINSYEQAIENPKDGWNWISVRKSKQSQVP